jgi:hypothetical protein
MLSDDTGLDAAALEKEALDDRPVCAAADVYTL